MRETNISSFEKKISLENDILKYIKKSKKEKSLKRNDNFLVGKIKIKIIGLVPKC